MIIEAVATGKSVEEATEKAIAELGSAADKADVEIEILTMAKPKTLGLFGGTDAKVRVFVEVEDKKAPNVPKAKKEEKVSEKAEKKEKEEKICVKMDKKTEKKVVDYLKSILENMGIENIKIEVVFEKDGTKINFDGDKLGVAIGRKGETLDAIQHLVSLVANKGQNDYIRITLNPGEYRQKKEELLVALANKSAVKAIKFNKNVILEAMNSYERRIIHNAVQEIEGVESWSIGENDHRRVCIGTSKDNKPFRENRGRRNRGNYNRGRKPSNNVQSSVSRAPKSDNDLPLYGVIK